MKRLNKLILLSGAALACVSLPAVNAATNIVEQAVILTPPSPPTPRINGAGVFGVRPGAPFLYTIPATGDRPMRFFAKQLPGGLNLDPQTGRITGILKNKGEFIVTLGATNALGSAEKKFRIVCGDKIALTPPMGWNSWNYYHCNINEQKIRAAAEAMVSMGLINHGWTYINMDDCWQGTRDATGNIRPSEGYSDMKAMVDFIHAKGLKAGIYSSPGPQTCANAVGSYGHEEQDAATYASWGMDFLKYDLCTFNELIQILRGERYGALLNAEQQQKLAQVGSDLAVLSSLLYQHDPKTFPNSEAVADAISRFKDLDKNTIAELWAKTKDQFAELINEARKSDPAKAAVLDEDYLKESFGKMRAALDKVNRDIVYSCSGGGTGGRKLGGNLWRTTTDITATWESVESNGFSQNGLERWAGPGGWNDPDMLEIGNGKFTPDECYSHMTLWCLLSAPLLIGCDMTKMSPLTLSLFSNDEVLAVDQDELGRQAWRATKDGATEVWMKPLADGSTVVGLFNRGEAAAKVCVRWSDLKLSGQQLVRDLWRQKDLGIFENRFESEVPRHGVMMLKLQSRAAIHSSAAADRWALDGGAATVWKVENSSLPHDDFIEQGGRRVGQRVLYSIKADGTLSVKRIVIWPSLRRYHDGGDNTDGHLMQPFGEWVEPTITLGPRLLEPLKVTEVRLDGTLTFIGRAGVLEIKRVIFPAFEKYSAVERWTLTNRKDKPVEIAVANVRYSAEKDGPRGWNLIEAFSDGPEKATLEPGKSLSFSILFSARPLNAAPVSVDGETEEKGRRNFIQKLNESLILETPDPVLNTAFTFAKWRVAEAINDTHGGMMLAPGGMKYFAATWCNDNVEYAGPFFPFLGEAGGNAGSLNAYRQYIPFMKPTYERIPCSIIAEGTETWGPFDRGDAAMYAYGASRFCLALGDKAIAQELWKGIEWTLEYCKRKLTPEGVVASDRDELEGRLPTGKANLSTTSLYYGGLRSAANLARSLGKTAQAADYDHRADALALAIETYFGFTVGGFNTYRYYAGNDVLRSWICLPLAMGIFDRKQGTLDALFSSKMWTPDGVASKSGDTIFWDRSTLYALRAAFQAGDTARALDYLGQYTRRRLLGEHAPYAVEAFPEGGQSQLAAESGLYCRIFVEGLFGILPTGLDRFQCAPRLPDGWPAMALRHVKAFGRDFDVVVERSDQNLRVRVSQGNKVIQDQLIATGETLETVLK